MIISFEWIDIYRIILIVKVELELVKENRIIVFPRSVHRSYTF